MYFPPPVSDACATHLTIFDVFALILFGESFRLEMFFFFFLFSFIELSITFAFCFCLPLFCVTHLGVLSSMSGKIGLGIV